MHIAEFLKYSNKTCYMRVYSLYYGRTRFLQHTNLDLIWKIFWNRFAKEARSQGIDVQGLCMPRCDPSLSLLSPPGEAPPTPVPSSNVGKEASTKLPGLWVVIIVLVATALLALNVSAIVCIVRRRRNKRASPPTKKTPPPSVSSTMAKAMPLSVTQGKSLASFPVFTISHRFSFICFRPAPFRRPWTPIKPSSRRSRRPPQADHHCCSHRRHHDCDTQHCPRHLSNTQKAWQETRWW